MNSTSFVIFVNSVHVCVCVHNVHTQLDGIWIVGRDAVTSRLSWRDLGPEEGARSTHPRRDDEIIIPS